MNYENDKIHWGSDSNEQGWYDIEGLYSWGDSLDALLKNAYSVKIDKDGGEAGFVDIDDLPEEAVEMIKEWYNSVK